MYLNKIIFGLVLSATTIAVTAQERSLLGTKATYLYTPAGVMPPPAGYAPVFVNHVGRHGSRFMTKAGADVAVLYWLEYAAKKDGLTNTGKELLNMTRRFLSIEKGNYENITLLGAKEQAAIGARVKTMYATAFKGNGVDVVTTFKVRTQQSANAFMQPFKDYKGATHFTVTKETEDEMLRFYDLAPAYEAYTASAAVKQSLDSLEKDKRNSIAAGQVFSKIFTGQAATVLAAGKEEAEVNKKKIVFSPGAFADNLYDLYSISGSFSEEMKRNNIPADSINFSIAFSKTSLQWFAFKNGASDFIEKGPAHDTLGVQVKIAAPLLVSFIKTTDSIVSHKVQKDAVLRFTHAEAISPFATLLGIRKASQPASSIFDYNKQWHPEEIIPLSANIQWILYTNGKEYLVKILLNEKPETIPVATNTFPYYKWADVRAYYVGQLAKTGLAINGDTRQFLQALK